MSRLPRQPLSYASPTTAAQDTPASPWRMAMAVAYLLIVLLGLWAALNWLDDAQDAWVHLLYNLVQGGTFPAVLTRMALACIWPALLTVLIGVAASSLLWHLSPRRVMWLAILPGILSLWSCVMDLNSGAVIFTGVAATVLAGVVQAMLICIGVWWGRPVARFIVVALLPPPLAAELLPFWRN